MADEEAGDRGPEEGTKYTFNSVELRTINVKMQPVPPLGGTPLETVATVARPKRSAAKAAAEFVRNILFTARRQTAHGQGFCAIFELVDAHDGTNVLSPGRP